jgi:thiamine biosynthesis lipoprotein
METRSYTFDGIGTRWAIDFVPGPDTPDNLPERILHMVEDYDRRLSRFIEGSVVRSIANKPGQYEVGEEFVSLLLHYLPLYHLTGGAVTPTIGHLLEQTGYDATYSLKERPREPVPDFLEAVEIVDGSHIRLREPVLFDFGALGKGYLIDRVAELIRTSGSPEYAVDAGGDMVVHTAGSREWKVGLEHPDDTSKIVGVVGLRNRAIAGSAGNRRTWGRFHHILNPNTLESTTGIKAVWVVAESATEADGLSTCLFFVPADRLQGHYRFEYLIVRDDLTMERSSQFPGTFFT